MKSSKKKKLLVLLILICLNINVIFIFTNNSNNKYNNTSDATDDSSNSDFLKPSNGFDRKGKEFSTITPPIQSCYINREQSSLNIQPSVYIPNYYISQANMMNFEDIVAVNYTREIEAEPSEFIFSSREGPTIIYQKFYVEVSQYVNNVSVLIQDINNPRVFTDENSWKVAIVNCSNDIYGTPNSNETIGELKKPHPLIFAAHWEVFDFKNSDIGSIFLNISNTKSTYENGITKYFFAIKITMPPDDEDSGGGPKFIYFSPDGGAPTNIGEGETFAQSPEFQFDNYTTNYVIENETVYGEWINGGLSSFREFSDTDRYFAKTNDSKFSLDITTRFELKNLTQSQYTYGELLKEIVWKSGLDWWFREHHNYIFSIDLYIATNISNTDFIDNTTLYIYSLTEGRWLNISDYLSIDIDINQTNEELKVYKIRNPFDKLLFLLCLRNLSFSNFIPFLINPDHDNPNNSLSFKFEYFGNKNGHFNVTIDQFTIDMGELAPLETIQQHDPMIQRLYYANNASVINGTDKFVEQGINSLNLNDNDCYWAQADTNNLTLEFDFNIVTDLDNSSWDVDFYDWIASYPNPIIPQTDIRISSNVSITHLNNLSHAILEVYKGDKIISIFPPEYNELEWIPLSDNKSFAFRNDTTEIVGLDAGMTWIMLHLMNESNNNALKLRLRYVGNESQSFKRFNVSIDEFTLNIYIQNAISSDITSKIGLGLNSDLLKPGDIDMKNFGTKINDVANQTGSWAGYVPGGIPTQGVFEFNVTSLWHAIIFNVTGTYEIYKFEVDIEFEDKLEIQYMTGTNYFSVEVTDGLGDPIEDLEITFELLDADGKIIDEDTAITNDEGIAKASLKFDDVGDGYSIKVSFDEEGIYASEDIESDEFRIVDDFTLFMDTFLIYLPYIIAALAGISIFIAVRHHKHSKLRRIWAEDALILDDLLKISYVLIMHKEAGVTIYNKQISMDLDSDLIGGFLTAISQFRSEIKKPKEEFVGGKGFEMDYYDFKIIINDGDYVRVAFILDGIPSENLQGNQENFTDDFEKKFSSLLVNFIGDIRPFVETDQLVERHFDISLMYPLQLGKHWQFTELNKLETSLVEVAEQMEKERKFFFISRLLSYGLAGRKASRDQIISTILNLKRRGIIVPVEIE